MVRLRVVVVNASAMTSKSIGEMTRAQHASLRYKGLEATTTNAHALARVVGTGLFAILSVTGSVAAQISTEGGGATISLSLEHLWFLFWVGIAVYAITLAHKGLKSNYRIEEAMEDSDSEEDKRAATAIGSIELTAALQEAIAQVFAGVRDEAKEFYKRRSEKLEAWEEANFDSRMQNNMREVVDPLREEVAALTHQTVKNTSAIEERAESNSGTAETGWHIRPRA